MNRNRKQIDFISGALILGDGIDLSLSELPLEIDLLTESTYRGYSVPGSTKVIDFTVTGDDIDACVAHFQNRRQKHPNRDLVIDYEHQTWTGGEAPAAGWITELVSVVRNGKKVLRARIKEWTNRAKEYLSNKEYRYISPVFALNATDKQSAETERCIFYNAGLTNEPLFDELLPIVARFDAGNGNNKIINGKDTTMDELLERLRYFLGLPITSTAEEISAELTKLVGQIKEAVSAQEETVTAKMLLEHLGGAGQAVTARTQIFEALGLKPVATVEEATAKIIAARQSGESVATLQQRVTQLEAERLNEQVTTIIARAIEEGKIIPATKDAMTAWAKKDLDAFKLFLGSAPVVGPLKPIPGSDSGSKGAGLTETDLTIAKSLKVDEELLKKWNPAA